MREIDNLMDRRALRKLKQRARDRERRSRSDKGKPKPRTVSAHDDNLAERKRIEKAWKQSIDFFESIDNRGTEGGSDNGKA